MSGLFPDVQPSLGFPQPLAEKYRPKSIGEFIGLEKQKKVLAAFSKRPVSCAWLLLGPSGLGKSTMAMALAEELKADLHLIPSQKCNVESVEQTWRMCWNIPLFGPSGWHVILADEADQMSAAAQNALLSKLDSTNPAPQTIWIFTANDTSRLEKRFLSRCRVLEFSSYGMRAELASMLAQVWQAETGEAGSLDFERVAKDSTNNVRDALQTLEIELLAR
jgi:replication-associated recombination protein RarA